MKIKISKKILGTLFVVSNIFILGFANTVYGADLLPEPIRNLMDLLGEDGSGASEFAASRVRLLLLLGLGGLILAAVIYAGIAAFKYIRSQGDPSQVEEAGKAVKSIFVGLGVLLISVIGIVLIFLFFGIEIFNTSTYQVCISAPGSQGCNACNDAGLDPNWENIKFDTSSSFDRGLMANPSNTEQRVCTQCEWEYFRISRGADISLDPACTD